MPDSFATETTDHKLTTLIEEYKEMRNEIRSTYSQYFSIVFGIIFSGTFGAFYIAFDKPFLFVFVPYMVMAWICIVIIIRMNLQHIASHITLIEKEINKIVGDKVLIYESSYAKLLWFSPKLKFLAAIPFGVLLLVSGFSIHKAYLFFYHSPKVMMGIYFRDFAPYYALATTAIMFVIVPAFIFMPERVFKKERVKESKKL